MSTDSIAAEQITEVGDVKLRNKVLVCLHDEPFLFDPYLVRSVEGVDPDARSRHGETARITFVDGGYKILFATDFDSLVEQIAEVFQREQQ